MLAHARKGEGDLHVLEHRLVGDEIIALENKADGMISVGIPIAVTEILCGFAVDDKVSLRVAVKTSYDIEHRCLSAAGRAQYGNEFRFTELKIYTAESHNVIATRGIHLTDIAQFKHL